MDDIKLWVIIAQLINFWIIFFIFKYFLGEKIVTAIEERRKFLKASKDAWNLAKEKIEEAEKQVDSMLVEARKKAVEIESYAEELSKQNSNRIIERSEKEAEYMLESARTQIEKERLDMENNMKTKIIYLSLKLNSKIFNKESANKDFIEKEYDLLVK